MYSVGGLGRPQSNTKRDWKVMRRQRTLETPDDRAGRLEADRMRACEYAKSSRDPSALRDKTGSREK